jgi:hypothetical protein
MTGECHCGNVQISISRPPAFLYCCNCSLCRKSGALWGYFSAEEVMVGGHAMHYRRCDKAINKGTLHFCGQCGNTSHWMADADAGTWTYAVNMRIFEASLLKGLPVHYPDGANWTGNGSFGFFRDTHPHDGISH